jgi:hypothetical protein
MRIAQTRRTADISTRTLTTRPVVPLQRPLGDGTSGAAGFIVVGSAKLAQEYARCVATGDYRRDDDYDELPIDHR